jgi:hypothetical protein
VNNRKLNKKFYIKKTSIVRIKYLLFDFYGIKFQSRQEKVDVKTKNAFHPKHGLKSILKKKLRIFMNHQFWQIIFS